VINYQDFLYGISLPDIHLDLVFINDVLIYQTLAPKIPNRVEMKRKQTDDISKEIADEL
jgi:hypothetical protein